MRSCVVKYWIFLFLMGIALLIAAPLGATVVEKPTEEPEIEEEQEKAEELFEKILEQQLDEEESAPEKVESIAIAPKKRTKPAVRNYPAIFGRNRVESAQSAFAIYKVGADIYFELPLELLGRRMLIVTTLTETSNRYIRSLGFSPAPTLSVTFERGDSAVYLCSADQKAWYGDSLSGVGAYQKSSIKNIMETFKIEAYSPQRDAVLIKVTKLFTDSQNLTIRLDESAVLEGLKAVVSNRGGERMLGVEATKDAVSVDMFKNYNLGFRQGAKLVGEQERLTVKFRRSVALLDSVPMRPRLSNPRMAVRATTFTEFEEGFGTQKQKAYVYRWRLVPTSYDSIAAGGLSDVEKPIVFHIDPALPSVWVEAIESAAGKYNEAFERFGFTDVVRLMPYPDDGEFNVDDFDCSSIRYSNIPAKYASWSLVTDPHTHEMLRAVISLPHNLEKQIHLERFLSTASFDPLVRSLQLSDQMMVEGIENIMLRVFGVCFGFARNSAASAAFSPDSITSPTFSVENGITSSVTDPVVYNFLLNKSNFEAGARVVQNELGILDHFTLEWLYAPVLGTNSPEEEEPYLLEKVRQHWADPIYHYQINSLMAQTLDPLLRTSDLSNDNIYSSEKYLQNLAYIIENGNEWLDSADYDYGFRRELQTKILSDIKVQLFTVLRNVGGVNLYRQIEGDPRPPYRAVGRELQRKSLKWHLGQITNLEWADKGELFDEAGPYRALSEEVLDVAIGSLFRRIDMMWLSESKSKNPYSQIEAMKDVMEVAWRGTAAGREINEATLRLQSELIDCLISWLELPVKKVEATASLVVALGVDELLAADCGQSESVGLNSYRGSTIFKNEVKPDRSHIWLGLLKECRAKLSTAQSSAPNTVLRNHYGYLIAKIDQTLSVD